MSKNPLFQACLERNDQGILLKAVGIGTHGKKHGVRPPCTHSLIG